MAPPRKHATGRILDAARTVALRDGPRATSVAAIAAESGAPAGTLYHRFGRRDRILQETWLRALGRFHDEVLAGAGDPDPVEAGVAMAVAAVRFARRWPDDARLLVDVRRRDLLDGDGDGDGDPAFAERLAIANAPVEAAIARLTDALGGTDAEGREAVVVAVVDLPGAAVRRHTRTLTAAAGGRADGAENGELPPWLEGAVATTARRLLTAVPGA